jgi:hypothetical protein
MTPAARVNFHRVRQRHPNVRRRRSCRQNAPGPFQKLLQRPAEMACFCGQAEDTEQVLREMLWIDAFACFQRILFPDLDLLQMVALVASERRGANAVILACGGGPERTFNMAAFVAHISVLNQISFPLGEHCPLELKWHMRFLSGCNFSN